MPNQVLSPQHRQSRNFYQSDKLLQDVLASELSESGMATMLPRLNDTGALAATEMNELSLLADQHPPKLIPRDFYGETADQIRFHPAYHRLTEIAVQSGMFWIKWHPDNQLKFRAELHRLGFSTGFLFAMSENGLYCPLCMTDGAARLVDRYCSQEDKNKLLPHIYTQNYKELYTGAMFLTEKAGGSDVGANLVTAEHTAENYYHLNGEKWFCSNANADIIFALARTEKELAGTRGLGIFLVEKQRPDGSNNRLGYIRLKDKLGVRSMASAECQLVDVLGKLVGKPTEGFKIMTDMINLSRLYNSVTAVADMRRALVEVYQFLSFRTTFGENALNHSLIRLKLYELQSLYIANFYLTWATIRTLDEADNGNETALELIRFLTPMLKKCTAEKGVYIVRESMELMGGMGYMEDGVLPKIMRDCMVLPIWEGAGNIMTLDMLRAAFKSKGLQLALQRISEQLPKWENDVQTSQIQQFIRELQSTIAQLPSLAKDVQEPTALFVFQAITDLFQIATLLSYRREQNAAWITPALTYLMAQFLDKKEVGLRQAPARATIEAMFAWEF